MRAPSTSSAAACRGPRPPGRSRALAYPSSCTKCGLGARPRRTRPTTWPNWSAPTRSVPTTPRARHRRPARGDAPARLAGDDDRRRPRAPGGRGACRRPRRLAAAITAAIEADPLIEVRREEISTPAAGDWDSVIIATGPLTSPALADAIAAPTGEAALAFFDAIAPIVHRDTIDFGIAWFQSRYDKAGPGGTGADYINCPLTRAIRRFRRRAHRRREDRVPRIRETTPYFDGCLPIEVMAERGRETLRHGPMKPFGLTDPRQTRHEALCRGATAPGQQARHAVQHGRFPDQAEARRTGPHLPH